MPSTSLSTWHGSEPRFSAEPNGGPPHETGHRECPTFAGKSELAPGSAVALPESNGKLPSHLRANENSGVDHSAVLVNWVYSHLKQGRELGPSGRRIFLQWIA